MSQWSRLMELHEEFGAPASPAPVPTETELTWRPFAGGAESLRTPGVLGWALARYEIGCDRDTVLEGLSDHLLALRALLEGGGPAGLGVPVRFAALCAEPEQRLELRQLVERAQSLERRLMRGAVTNEADERLALDVACHVRSIVAAATRGELGSDLRATADEILITDGIGGGGTTVDMGETSEWDPFSPTTSEETQVMEVAVVTPITRAHEIRAENNEQGWRREYDEISTRQHRKPRDFFPNPETTEWSIGELQFSALRD